MRRMTLLAIALAGGLVGCATNEFDAGLFAPGKQTGTAYLYRVDDSWRGDERCFYGFGAGFLNDVRAPASTAPGTPQLPAPCATTAEDARGYKTRFAPLRNAYDTPGLDTDIRRVNDDDYVTITLKSGFLKYFRDLGGQNRTGEIAILLSFYAEGVASDNILIFASEDQTLGSFLPLTDWPILGPIKIGGDSLLMRVVVMEQEEKERETMRALVSFAALAASAVQPQAAPIVKLGSEIASLLINQNRDDVVVDHRFSLQRTMKGRIANRLPLMYGKYVMLLQEDRLLRDGEVLRVSPTAVLPPAVDDMRFDQTAHRLIKAYSFPAAWAGDPPTDDDRKAIAYSYEATRIPVAAPPAPTNVTVAGPSDPVAVFRETHLGFRRGAFSPEQIQITANRERAQLAAVMESCRQLRVAAIPDNLNVMDDGFWTEATLRRLCPTLPIFSDLAPLEYPMTVYPAAGAVMNQYALHTHFVLSVDPTFEAQTRFDELLAAQEAQPTPTSPIAGLGVAAGVALDLLRRQEEAFKTAAVTNDRCESARGLIESFNAAATNGGPLVGDDRAADKSYFEQAALDEISRYLGVRNFTMAEAETQLAEDARCNGTPPPSS